MTQTRDALPHIELRPSNNLATVVTTVLVLALCAALLLPLQAQEMTPTLGPTKTPTPDAVEQTVGRVETTDENTVPVFDPLTQADLTVLTGNVQRPNGITWYEGNLYTACTGDGTVYEINDTTGATLTYIWGINNAHTLFAEADDRGNLNLWIPDYGASTLALITRSGVRTVTEDLNGPWGIAPIGDDFLVTNLLGSDLVRIDREGNVTSIIEGLPAPTGIALDDDYVYIGNNGSTRRAIEFYARPDIEAGTVSEVDNHVLVRGIQNVTGLQLGTDGRLYFAYAIGTRGVIGRIDPAACRASGGCNNDQVEVVVFTELNAPIAGLTLTPDMRIYLHTMFEPEILWAQL